MLQATDKIGTWGVHPRHLIDEDNLSSLWKGFQITFQRDESIKPCFGKRHFRMILSDALHEILQLNTHRNLIHACHIKGVVTANDFLYEESLSYAPTSIYSNKFGLTRIDVFHQLLLLFSTPNKKFIHKLLIIR